MNLDIFCESGEKYGWGHYKRCENLVAIFQSIFSPIKLKATFHAIPSPIPKKNYDIVIIDSYITPKEDYAFLSKYSKVLLCLDDFNRLKYPHKSLILSPTLARRGKFSGKDYVILHPSFSLPITQSPTTNQILITLGGSNQNPLIEAILHSLPSHYSPHIINPHFSHPNAHSNLSPQEICSLIDESEIIITAGGGSLNEALSRGKKILPLSLAPNQKPQLNAYANQFRKTKLPKSQIKNPSSPNHPSPLTSRIKSYAKKGSPIIFNPFKDFQNKFTNLLPSFIQPPLTFGSKLPSLAHTLFFQALNLPSNIIPFHSLTRFQQKQILKLRNQQEVREASFDSSPISLKTHLAFIQGLKQEWGMRISPRGTKKLPQKPKLQDKDSKHLCFAFLEHRHLIGAGTLTITSFTQAKIGLYKKMTSKKVGEKILKSLIEISQNIGIEELELEVLKNNARAIAFYQKHHFQTIKECENHLVMHRKITKE